MMNMEYILNNSLCKHCDHRVSRVVSTEGIEVSYYDEDDSVTVTDTSDEILDSFTHEYCTKLCVDLDHIVLDCTKFLLVDK